MNTSILKSSLATLCAVSFLATAAHAGEVPAQPINLILNKAVKGVVPDPDPQVIGQFGPNILFAANTGPKTRKLFFKRVTYIARTGATVSIDPSEIGTKKFPLKSGPAVKGAIDEYVYGEDNSSLGVAFFHERGKGIYRATENRDKGKVQFLKKTDTDPTGTDPEKMASGLSLLDWVGRYTDSNSNKRYLFPYLIFAAPDKKHGKELWLSDGSAGGTKFFADLDSSTSQVPNPKKPGKFLTVPNGSNILPASAYFPDLAESYGGSAYFSAKSGLADDGAGGTYQGYNVFRVDSVPDAPKKQPRVVFEKIFPAFELITQPTKLNATSDAVFFNLPTNLSNGVEELWAYEPQYPDFGPYPVTSGATFVPQNNEFKPGFQFGQYLGQFLSGVDGVNGREPFHASVFVGNGDAAVHSLGNINPVGSSNPRLFTTIGIGVFFVANPGTGEHLYRSDGNPSGLEDLGAFNNIRDITGVTGQDANGSTNGDDVYFVADNAQGVPVLWKTFTVESGVNTMDSLPTKVTTSGGFEVKNPANLHKLKGNGIYYLFFVCDGTGTEYETVALPKNVTRPAGRQVWYTGNFLF
jgi:ELWxxDGT repeat protein